jgi:hypothetical protein
MDRSMGFVWVSTMFMFILDTLLDEQGSLLIEVSSPSEAQSPSSEAWVMLHDSSQPSLPPVPFLLIALLANL